MDKSNAKTIDKTREFIYKNKGVISASILTLLCIFFFLVVGFPNFFRPIHYFSQRWFGIGVIIIYLFISLYLSYIQNWSWPKLVSIWIQTNILFLFSIAYFIRLNNSSLNFASIEISTGLIFIPLTAFIFAINKNLYQENKTSVLYSLGQVILISLCVFSLVYYIEIDNTSQRAYSNDILLQLFKLPTFIWLTLSGFSVSLISTLSLKLKDRSNSIIIFLFFLFTIIQSEQILSHLNLGYWAKTLILITIWDYLFNAILSFLKYPEYDKHRAKFIVSTIYHIILLVVIFVFNYFSF